MHRHEIYYYYYPWADQKQPWHTSPGAAAAAAETSLLETQSLANVQFQQLLLLLRLLRVQVIFLLLPIFFLCVCDYIYF